MRKSFLKNKGFATLEYTVLIILLLSALIAMTSLSKTRQGAYLQSALQGEMRKAGEIFGLGRQYNPKTTIDCLYDDKTGVWYSQSCYENEAYRCQQNGGLDCWQPAEQACTLGCAR
ncbi:MAG: hypothetical protein HQL16_08200 [Candidatus Omnitrophica bacterium]|nr:hypothetical protein [Candidatus Omnitrophota bacterium]